MKIVYWSVPHILAWEYVEKQVFFQFNFKFNLISRIFDTSFHT